MLSFSAGALAAFDGFFAAAFFAATFALPGPGIVLYVDGHRTAERRSLAYHDAIAERIIRDPSILERARAKVSSWIASGSVHPKWIVAWSELLARPLAEICDKLREPTEQMAALRQVTPFTGVLDARTRWALWRSVPH